MQDLPYVIDGFRELPGTAEIIGLGAVRPPFGGAQEVEIAVSLASDLDGPGSDAEAGSRVVWLGCGQLDLLPAGSRWRNGAHVGQAPGILTSAMFEFIGNEAIGLGADPQPAGMRPFPSRAFSRASGFLLQQVTAPGQKMWGPERVLLPQMELLRTMFGVSSGFLLELFDGIRNPAVSGERGLVSRERSRLRKDGTVVLTAARDLSRDEAIIAAAVVADDDVRKLHDSAFQQLSVSRRWRDGRPEFMNLAWPWKVPISISMEGNWVERVGARRRFIATRITAIGMPLRFDRVEVHHPGSEMSDRQDLPPPDGRMRPWNARLVVVTTGLAASPSRRPVEIATRTVGLFTASDIDVVSVPRGSAGRNDRGVIGEDPRDEAPFGTGGRQSRADVDVGSVATKRKRAEPREAVTRSHADALDATWTALQEACRRNGWLLDALPELNRGSQNARHGGLDLRREPLVARVACHNKRLLIVDRGSPAGDEVSLGILIPECPEMTDLALAVSARKACRAVGGRWRSPNMKAPNFRVLTINRSVEVWEDNDRYAAMLVRRIASALKV